MEEPERRKRDGRDVVALILAIGLALSLNVLAVGLVWVAITNTQDVLPLQNAGGIPENTTQILTLIFGGIVGVLGSYIGSGQKKDDGDGEQ